MSRSAAPARQLSWCLVAIALCWCASAQSVASTHTTSKPPTNKAPPTKPASTRPAAGKTAPARDKAASTSDHWRISMSNYGPVLIGMSPEQASQVLGAKLSAGAPQPPKGCHYLFAPQQYPGTYFMVSKGAIARIDFREPGPRTLSGFGVGHTEGDLRKRFGDRLQVTPHPYFTPDGHTLTLRSKDGSHAVRFNTDHGRVKTFEIGRTPEINWVDECS